jgi:ribonuclease P protein component
MTQENKQSLIRLLISCGVIGLILVGIYFVLKHFGWTDLTQEEIQEIVKTSKKLVSKYFIVYFRQNDFQYNRYCVSVSKKIGKAHTRNLSKRRIKDILIKNKLNNSIDYVIILRNAVTDILYDKMRYELLDILKGVK